MRHCLSFRVGDNCFKKEIQDSTITMSKRKQSDSYFDTVSEEDQLYDATTAAFVLCSMSYATVDKDTCRRLEEQKEAFRSKQLETMNEPEHEDKKLKLSVRPSRFPPIPVEFRYSMDGSELPRYPPIQNLHNCIGMCSYPFEKQVTPSDIKKNQSRITLNKSFVVTYFLPMLCSNENLTSGIPVMVYGPDGKGFNMTFKIWTKNYIINSGWNTFLDYYGIKACTYWMTIWMFRRRGSNDLCFAMRWKVNEYTTVLIPNRRQGKALKGTIDGSR